VRKLWIRSKPELIYCSALGMALPADEERKGLG
jgi:hypothetical protein